MCEPVLKAAIKLYYIHYSVFDCLTREYNYGHLMCIQINNHGFRHTINVLEKELKVNKKTVGTIFTLCFFRFP